MSNNNFFEKLGLIKNKITVYRNYTDSLFIRIILILIPTFYFGQWSCFMKNDFYWTVLPFNSIIFIDGIYILKYRKV
jgi:hypothetical protein